ncbi:alcohol dehydrogenase 2-like protein [Tanacetum coccineum]
MCDLLRINTDRGVMINDEKSRVLSKINPKSPLWTKLRLKYGGISTGLGATLNVAKPKKGSSVAVFGLGAVGLAVRLLKGCTNAGSIKDHSCVDLNANRFELAKKFGVTEFVNPKDYKKPVQEVIAEMTNGGVDRSGWGVAVLVGVPHKDAVFKTSPLNLLNERTLKGTFFGNYKPRSDIPSVVEKYMNKELELEKFITHEVPFSEINKAFDLMLKGEGLRCIIRMGE